MVRLALPEDAVAIADAHISGWQVAYRGIFPDEYLDSMDREQRGAFWEEMISNGGLVVVAEGDGKVVGFSNYGPSRHDPDWGELYAIYVHPDHWGEGHGRDLITATEHELAGLGHDRAYLWVLDRNERARAFYERQGWTINDETMDDAIGGVKITEVRYDRFDLQHQR